MTQITIQPTFKDRLGIGVWRTVFKVITAVIQIKKVPFPGTFTEHAYGSHPDERLDFIEAASNVPARTPIFYIHGGGWVCGQKEMFYKQLAQLAEAGHPVFNVEYPLAPESPHPQALLSLFTALAWIRQNYPQYDAVHLVGDSAGGNLAMMLGILINNPSLTHILGANVVIDTPQVQSIVSMYGVLDRLTWIKAGFPGASLFMRNYAGEATFAPEVDPQHAITPMDLSFDLLPPVFIAVGTKDKLATSSRIFSERLQAESRSVKYKVYPDADHGFFTWGTGSVELLSDVLAFFSQG